MPRRKKTESDGRKPAVAATDAVTGAIAAGALAVGLSDAAAGRKAAEIVANTPRQPDELASSTREGTGPAQGTSTPDERADASPRHVTDSPVDVHGRQDTDWPADVHVTSSPEGAKAAAVEDIALATREDQAPGMAAQPALQRGEAQAVTGEAAAAEVPSLAVAVDQLAVQIAKQVGMAIEKIAEGVQDGHLPHTIGQSIAADIRTAVAELIESSPLANAIEPLAARAPSIADVIDIPATLLGGEREIGGEGMLAEIFYDDGMAPAVASMPVASAPEEVPSITLALSDVRAGQVDLIGQPFSELGDDGGLPSVTNAFHIL